MSDQSPSTQPQFRVALITGAGSGVGAAAVEALITSPSAGSIPWHVALVGRREQQLRDTATLFDPSGARTLCVVGDVSDPDAVAAVFAQVVAKWGRVDVLFNNAGVTNDMGVLFEDIAAADWKRVIDINLTGSFLCAQEAFKVMKRQGGGRIINNGSVSAIVPRPNSAPYTASKHAISGLTKSLALDGRKYNIACSQLDIGNAASALLTTIGSTGALQADGSRRPEPTFDVKETGRAIRYMAELPPEVNVLGMQIMATKMPSWVGRG
ncbi:dehydrogenase [Gonapodya prolifera JEL478]|uniref:Dehydrogenase n=1 Tax=Gonapodya prolifera (strain JEL478) TaxID=1344416 RepID=A0A139AR67_GONPJ|nr:dehydrogenase [Gonapodya prolifera JEL478]|eukprot:KXS19144.1 dehydrogenase [Gonapodya prolifera JEL478]